MLIANDQDQLQEIVTRVKDESSKAGLDMNVKKTKTMIISRNPEGKKVDIKVDNETIQQVEKFIYLGTLILEEIKTDKEIESRKNIAKEKFSSMAKILKSKRLKLTAKLKSVISIQSSHMGVRHGLFPKFLKLKLKPSKCGASEC